MSARFPIASRAVTMTLLLWGDTARSAALRHEIPLAILDPLLFAQLDGRTVILTSRLECDRIAEVLPQAELLDFEDLGMRERIAQGMSYEAAEVETAARAVAQLGIAQATVPGTFPLALADRLRADGVRLVVDDGAVNARRRRKSGRELEGIRVAQRAAEAGMSAAARVLAQAQDRGDGRLVLAGKPLLAEDVRAALRQACADHGAPCPPEVMVASAWSGYGHDPGSGPLPAGLPITVDLWPCHEETGCWADMTRTFVVGEVRPEAAELVAEQERLVREALEDARAAIRPGVSGRELHARTCERFEAAGFPTARKPAGEHPNDGFRFALGHGVGLQVHEDPHLGISGRDPLLPGDVVAVEPGLTDHRFGGVRFEDLILVTEDGAETLTRYSYDLDPSRGSS